MPSIIVIGKGELEYSLVVDRAGTVVCLGIGTPTWFRGKKLYTILDTLTSKGFEYRREVKVSKNDN